MKLLTKVDKNSVSRNHDDQRTKAQEMHVRPAIGNTFVGSSFSSRTVKMETLNWGILLLINSILSFLNIRVQSRIYCPYQSTNGHDGKNISTSLLFGQKL